MADTWHTLAQQARRAANKLAADEPRSCASRAYYAVYAKVTHELSRSPGVTFAGDREGPSHPGTAAGGGPGDGGIRRMIVQTMTQLSIERRHKLSELVGELYGLRIDADYRPSRTVDDRAARRAVAMMKVAFDAL